jgi:hypothetical protein
MGESQWGAGVCGMRMLCDKLRREREREREALELSGYWEAKNTIDRNKYRILDREPRECCVRMDEKHVKETRGRHWRNFGMWESGDALDIVE